jgi:hypothetical protein
MNRVGTPRGRKLVSLAGVIVLLAIGFGGRAWLNANGNVVYAFQGNLFTIPAKPKQVVAFDFTFQNRSQRPLTLESVGFPGGLSRHFHLLSVFAMQGQAPDGPVFGWPTHQLLRSVKGFQVAAKQYVSVAVVLKAPTSGVYVVGPVSLAAQVPIAFVRLPLQVLDTEGMAVCVRVYAKECRSIAEFDIAHHVNG